MGNSPPGKQCRGRRPYRKENLLTRFGDRLRDIIRRRGRTGRADSFVALYILSALCLSQGSTVGRKFRPGGSAEETAGQKLEAEKDQEQKGAGIIFDLQHSTAQHSSEARLCAKKEKEEGDSFAIWPV
ncbi:hypothetical protein DAPPUDRAFT_111753 [Daphnia pulex]|uniref:Uncharacterized protein n=1 Tax=Daphnia pulex TaxID=6669 RepID=E9HA25_DAPPU|nr:hypothetical protein DAPPUDRAFT_111753 [Daphnia pulex]|eukprot:EFX71351.1 hypothetical protein DAPPUDRAFT_111753 [Daphnia pulex]